MSEAIANLEAAIKKGNANRPKVGGFPYLAETLRQAGVTRNLWYLPACESVFYTKLGPVVMQSATLVSGAAEIPSFCQEALVLALRNHQAGNSTFPEFLIAAWKAGVIRYEVDFEARNVSYYGCNDEKYVESYPAVTV